MCLAALTLASPISAQARARARELGVAPGIFQTGANNAITDVAGVKVGHATIISGDSIHTGVTAILPHDGNLYIDRVPAAVHIGNAFGKLVGSTQVKDTRRLIYNSLFMATSVNQRGRTVEAIPLDLVRQILARYNTTMDDHRASRSIPFAFGRARSRCNQRQIHRGCIVRR